MKKCFSRVGKAAIKRRRKKDEILKKVNYISSSVQVRVFAGKRGYKASSDKISHFPAPRTPSMSKSKTQ